MYFVFAINIMITSAFLSNNKKQRFFSKLYIPFQYVLIQKDRERESGMLNSDKAINQNVTPRRLWGELFPPWPHYLVQDHDADAVDKGWSCWQKQKYK